MSRASAIASLLLPLVPVALPAQSQALVGAWDVSLPMGMRVENGEPTPILAAGSLVVSIQGDSVVALLKLVPTAEVRPRPDARLVAPVSSGPTVFVHRSTATINDNGTETTHPVTSTFTLAVSGDSLKGTVERRIEGMDSPMAGPQPFTGRRTKPSG